MKPQNLYKGVGGMEFPNGSTLICLAEGNVYVPLVTCLLFKNKIFSLLFQVFDNIKILLVRS